MRWAAVALALLLGAAAPDPAAEVTRRSGVPAAEVAQILARCQAPDVSQTALNFCAWRDLVAAENRLIAVVARARAVSPTCGAMVEERITREGTQIDQVCAEEAAKEYGGGSAEGFARNSCAGLSRVAVADELERTSPCHTR